MVYLSLELKHAAEIGDGAEEEKGAERVSQPCHIEKDVCAPSSKKRGYETFIVNL